MVENITSLLSFLTLLADVVIVLSFLAWLIAKFSPLPWLWPLKQLINHHGLIILLIITLAPTLGSLFFSEIALYAPCRLCWYQRIFTYPQVILLATAMIKKSRAIVTYLIPLSLIGAAISVYQYYLQIQATLRPFDPLTPCSLDGASCAAKYFFSYGYITIPMMALTAFLLIIIVSIIIKGENKNL